MSHVIDIVLIDVLAKLGFLLLHYRAQHIQFQIQCDVYVE
jgi:hypothetical protein